MKVFKHRQSIYEYARCDMHGVCENLDLQSVYNVLRFYVEATSPYTKKLFKLLFRLLFKLL
jgi:hypothetical protein